MLTEKIGGGVTLINRPDKWTANTEYDFGGGLYGQRFTGTITASANTRINTALLSSGATQIINCGGEWYAGNYEPVIANNLSASGTIYQTSSLERNSNGKIVFYSIAAVARSSAPYDVWVLYTK